MSRKRDMEVLANQETELSSYIGRMLRDHFGKGPESVFVSLNEHIIIVYLRNFLSPMEKVLMDRGETRTVLQTRDMLMQTLIPEIKAYVKVVSGIEIEEFYYDWGLHNKSGLFAGIMSESEKAGLTHYPEKQELHQKISRISQ